MYKVQNTAWELGSLGYQEMTVRLRVPYCSQVVRILTLVVPFFLSVEYKNHKSAKNHRYCTNEEHLILLQVSMLLIVPSHIASFCLFFHESVYLTFAL